MNLKRYNQYCRSKHASTYVNQWGGSDVWKIGGKVFALARVDKNDILGISFKTSEANFYFLREKDNYRPAPYLASRGMLWIQYYDSTLKHSLATDSDPIIDEELAYYLDESYRLVSLNLTKKLQRELGLI
ncbi:MmcQ/YjbR family DNA-binding protein [Glaciecola petra]|uniref:MmcQ/YjbR family DNA-binding protein n=1 Tax=Glaciecola petra TaxID=3075602 RepID=A0ABU2ZRD1_9ALTE|nr:MmcQ/YjbR family DNA-binding protein [Aestuariibacter sp. P117]MDT0594951.1 MmcQ/YjbR family DNA-binding protein [Aestuariibacter sp. P117]